MTTNPEAVEALGIAMYKNANAGFSGTIQEHAQAALGHLEAQGFAITRQPAMTELELEREAIYLMRDIVEGLNGWAGIMALAKKYRG